MKRFLKIFWIFFAWLIVLILVASIIEIFTNDRTISFGRNEIFSIIYLPMVVSVIGYAHRWKIWKSGVYFWRAYFFVYIASGIAQILLNNYIPSQLAYHDLFITLVGVVIPLIITLVSIIGIYLYAFRFLIVNKQPQMASPS
jgi:hypothetical protein